MTKLVLLLTFLGLGFLFVAALLIPTNSAVWLASTSLNFAYLRLALMLVIAALLVTRPPRNVIFRVFVGIMAVGLAGWSLSSTYTNHMQILDSMSILVASIATGLTVLEYKPDPVDRYANYELF